MTVSRIYQWLLIDADGTLFNYALAEKKALEGTFRNFCIPFAPGTSDLYRKFNHEVWVDFEKGQISASALRVVRFERLFQAAGITADAEAFSQRYLYNLSAASDLLDGAEAAVRALRGKFRMAIITNGLRDVQRPRLAHSAIAGDFEHLAISEEMGVAKPSARFFEVVLAQIGSPRREEVLVVGDSLSSDILGGINAGIDTCWFNPAGAPADPQIPPMYEVHSWDAFLALLDVE